MTAICDTRHQTAELGNSRVRHVKSPEPHSDSHINVNVVFTTHEGTRAALRAAGELARNLGLRIALIAAKAVSFHFPLDHPPVSANFLKQRLLTVVYDSGVDAEQISMKVYYCRDQRQGLRQLLVPNSLVVVGGGRHWWQRRERELAQYLRSLGHRVVFVDVRSKFESRAQSSTYSG